MSSADALPTRRQLRLAAQREQGGPASAGSQRERPLTRREIRARERAAAAERAADGAREDVAPDRDDRADAPGTSAQPISDEQMASGAEAVTTGPVVLGENQDQVQDRDAVAVVPVDVAGEHAAMDAHVPGDAAAQKPSTSAHPFGEVVLGQSASNREQRRAARRRSASQRGGTTYRWLPRLAVLGALGALTTVVPLSGAATPATSTEMATGNPVAANSAYDVLTSGGTPDFSGASTALAADPLASLRSLVSASRSGTERIPSSCVTTPVQANGVLASEVEATAPPIVQPLVEGNYQLTSRYGNRVHPIWGSYGQHTGLDMSAAAGTPIHAVADGTVTYAGVGRDGRSSMLVIIEHEVDGEKFWTWYVHMYPNGVYVQAGQQVSVGETIGAVGSYGNSTGPHLHLEVHLDESLTTVDPELWLAEHAVPLTSETLQCTEN
ncbi:M23 family metallopeptidase [Ruania alkalisoli]|uniref:M23 family metallopeptidase n=1 Tax=Ruania alkalisoli TaxID=2779775 RepID=A0A7M1SST8_9MICO|nr:M23 family metallopeptidase [Ruania alkalisoli]QOR69673.1 M23 family metallopeptidase [Ruania alkalisoli]